MKVEMASADLNESDFQAVMEVLRTGRLALGPKVVEFEQLMAQYAGVKHALAVNSGTSGLHLIVRAMGLGPGDEVLVPSFTFAASVNAVLYEGATPVFVDIEPETLNLDPADVERKITPRTRAIMAVDVFGHPANWAALNDISRRHNIPVIDDCCEALGAKYQDQMIGQFGIAGCFAFYPNKQMTTGEGGIIVTNDDEIARLCRSMRNQGRGEMGAWLEHERLGYNYRLDEMSAALGVSQLARIEDFIAKRERVAQMYNTRLQGLSWVRPPLVRDDVRMSWFVYVPMLAEGLDRDPVMREMEAMGVPARGYFSPVHLQPYIRRMLDTRPDTLPVTEAIAQRTIALPFHNHLTEAEVDHVVEIFAKAVERVRGMVAR